jgi:hypothetical protein
MPGYIDDMSDGMTSDGMKQYGIKAFFYNQGSLFAIGTKSGGTGSKNFEKTSAEAASWTASTTGEGTYNLYGQTFLHVVGSRRYYITTNGGNTYVSYYAGTVTDAGATMETFEISNRIVAEYAYNDTVYINTGADDIITLASGAITDPAKDTAIRVRDLQSGDEQLGLFGHRFYPYRSQLLLWDGASTLADQKIEFGKGRAQAVGYVAGVWVGVVDENIADDNTIFSEESNGTYSLAVKYASVGTAQTLVRLHGATNTNGEVFPIRHLYRDGMCFYARIPTNSGGTTFKEGIWVVGRGTSGVALSLLLDTSSLTTIEGYGGFGTHHFFAHSGDGSISRLDNFTSGTYDVAAVYESLIFGSDTPNNKNLNGVSVMTENLPSGGSVVMKYRFDENDSWTTLGTSDTAGTQVHNFTGIIGEFTEIQFRFEVTGNAPVKNFYVSLQELETTPYDS